MPFAGSRDEAWAAVEALGRLHVLDGDELLLADNAGVAGEHRGWRPGGAGVHRGLRCDRRGQPGALAGARPERRCRGGFRGVRVDPVPRRRHGRTARPAGALFRRADRRRRGCGRRRDRGGAAGTVGRDRRPLRRSQELPRHRGAPGAPVHAPRRGRQPARAPRRLRCGRRLLRGVAGGRGHRLQLAAAAAGWALAGRPAAVVEHRYRDSLAALRRQWRGYAAGRAWLGTALRRLRAAAGGAARRGRARGSGCAPAGRSRRGAATAQERDLPTRVRGGHRTRPIRRAGRHPRR